MFEPPVKYNETAIYPHRCKLHQLSLALCSPMSGYITEDHLLQILKYLPVKSLFRFRCVSKWWKDTIDSDFFMREHLSVQSPKLLIAYERLYAFMVLDPQTLPLVQSLRTPYQNNDHAPEFGLLGTLHGIVCLYDNQYNEFMLWNPVTRDRSVTVAPPESIEEWDDWMNTVPYFGFWLDPSNRTFKIIGFTLVITDDDDKILDAVIFSSITKEWANIPLPEFMSEFTPRNIGPPVIIDGVAYWGALEDWMEDSGTLTQSQTVLVSFNFLQETFGSISGPCVSHGKSLPRHCKLQGVLSLVYWDEKDPHGCDIYLWQKDAWVKTFDFKLVPGITKVFWVLGGTKESCRVIASIKRALVMCDTKDGCIMLKRRLKESSMMFMAYDFVESLFSLYAYDIWAP